MARKSSKKKKSGGTHHSKKRGRMGAITSKETEAALMFLAAALIGKWGGNLVNAQIAKAFPTASAKMMGWGVGLGETAAGIYGFLEFKDPLTKGLAFGVAMNGGDLVEKQLGLISGVGYINLLPQRNMGNTDTYRQVPRLGNTPQQYRSPRTVGRKPNMTAVYAAGAGM